MMDLKSGYAYLPSFWNVNATRGSRAMWRLHILSVLLMNQSVPSSAMPVPASV